MISKGDQEGVMRRGFKHGFYVDSRGRSGGIGLWWRDLNVSIISFSNRHIMENICHPDKGNWLLVGIYGYLERENKWRTYDLMRSLTTNITKPFMFIGDFNQIVNSLEKQGGANIVLSEVQQFRDVIEELDLCDMGCSGGKFTWQRGRRQGSIIRERLDKGLYSWDWHHMFPQAIISCFPRIHSNHSLLRLSFNGEYITKKTRLFQFESLWLSHEQCSSIVSMAWNGNSGSPVSKIQDYPDSLSRWASKEFKGRKKRIEWLERRLTLLQQRPPDGLNLQHT